MPAAPETPLPLRTRTETRERDRSGWTTVVVAGPAGVVVAVYVDPPGIRQGVGSALLRHALDQARLAHSGPVRVESTLNAIGFYAKHGFREIGRGTTKRGLVEVPIVRMELAH